jgi:hypothetical protein
VRARRVRRGVFRCFGSSAPCLPALLSPRYTPVEVPSLAKGKHPAHVPAMPLEELAYWRIDEVPGRGTLLAHHLFSLLSCTVAPRLAGRHSHGMASVRPFKFVYDRKSGQTRTFSNVG